MNERRFTALVADDDRSIRDLVSRALARENFDCETVANGSEARDLLAHKPFDLVVVDLRMPEVHGYTLTAELLDQANRPVIIILTGVVDGKIAKDLITRGVDLVEFKPVVFQLLAAKAWSLVHRKRFPTRAESSDSARGSRSHPTLVGEVMTRDTLTVGENTPLQEVAQKMTLAGIRHLPVVDAHHCLSGLITQRDLMRHRGRWSNTGAETASLPVAEFMCRLVISAEPSMRLGEAVEVMIHRKIGCMPVVDGLRHVAGIITRSDLLRHLLKISG